MVVNFVLGAVGCGKSTYITNNFPHRDWVRARFGQWLRDAVGLEIMANDANPLACEVTDDWVHSHALNAVRFGIRTRRDVVFDGFPRKEDQYNRFFIDLARSRFAPSYRITHVVVPKHILLDRIRKRASSTEELDFDQLRLEQSLEATENMVQFVTEKIQKMGLLEKVKIVRNYDESASD